MNDCQETPLALGPEGQLAAVLCEPAAATAAPVACLLLNVGVGERTGLHRTNVKLARRLAELGITSMRIDLSGLGDSPAATSGLHFKDQAVADLQQGLDWLAQHRGIRLGMVFGVCSGALNAYLLAQADTRVVGLCLFDLFTELTTRGRLRLHLLDALGSTAADWRSLVREKLALRRIRKEAAPNMFESNATPVVPELATTAATLGAMAARGVEVQLLYSHMCATVCSIGRSGRPFAPPVRFERMDAVDHVLTPLAAQEEVMAAATGWATAVVARHPGQQGRTSPPGGA